MKKKTRIKNKENLSVLHPPLFHHAAGHSQIEENTKSIATATSESHHGRVFAPIENNLEKRSCVSSAVSESTRKSRDSTASNTLLNSKLSTSGETWSRGNLSKE